MFSHPRVAPYNAIASVFIPRVVASGAHRADLLKNDHVGMTHIELLVGQHNRVSYDHLGGDPHILSDNGDALFQAPIRTRGTHTPSEEQAGLASHPGGAGKPTAHSPEQRLGGEMGAGIIRVHAHGIALHTGPLAHGRVPAHNGVEHTGVTLQHNIVQYDRVFDPNTRTHPHIGADRDIRAQLGRGIDLGGGVHPHLAENGCPAERF